MVLGQILNNVLEDMRPTPWLDVLLAIGWDPASEENIPLPHNAVLTIPLDNRELSGSPEVFRLNGKLNPSQFAWFRLKYNDPHSTLLNYPNKGIAVGATTPNWAYYCLLVQINQFEKNGKHVHILGVPIISNIVLAAVLDSALDIARLYGEHSSRISYAPGEFSGATFRPFAEERLSGCTANLFEQGAYTILGAVSMRQAIEISKMIVELVKPFKTPFWNREHKVTERDNELRQVKRTMAGDVGETAAKRMKIIQQLIRSNVRGASRVAETPGAPITTTTTTTHSKVN